MRYCVVKNCVFWKQNEDMKLKFFRFPSNVERRKAWIKACGNPNVNHKSGTVCSLHFTDDDWRLKDKLLNIPIEKRLLNTNAVPSQHVFCNTTRTERSGRSLKRRSKKVVEEVLKDNQRFLIISEEVENSEQESECSEDIDIGNNQKNISVGVQTEVEIESARELRIIELEKALNASKKANKVLERENEQLSCLESSVGTIFTKSQIQRLRNPNKNMKWSSQDISDAILLHKAGPQAYRLLYTKGFPLPGSSTLRHYAGKLNVDSHD